MSLTEATLVSQLAGLNLPAGRPVLVHASMRRIGPVDGGAATVLSALRRALGPDTPIVVPAQTANNSTTSPAFRAATAALSPSERDRYVAGLAGFDPATTPSYGMGVLAEAVRTSAAAVRSSHPQTSFAAIGPGAEALMSVHRLESHLGEQSPLGALYSADASILLIGVGYSSCTAFHLAEYRLPTPPRRPYRCFVRNGTGRSQQDFIGLDLDDSDFGRLGAALEDEITVIRGVVGLARCRTLSMRAAVDFAGEWFGEHRQSR